MKPFSVLLALGLLIPLSGEEPSAPETAKPLLFKDSFQREFQELTGNIRHSCNLCHPQIPGGRFPP